MTKAIVVEAAEFRMTVSEGGQVKRTIVDMSFGRAGHHTPLVEHAHIVSRERMHISHKFPPPHGGAQMQFSLFFTDQGDAFHQGDTFISSHGCIHLSAPNAQWLFEWAGKDPVDVSVRGPYPAAPVRAHVYQVGGGGGDPPTIMLPRVTEAINQRLHDLGLLQKPVDRSYDQATADAVSHFQTANGLTADGKVGMLETAPRLGATL
jgi:hypothetical protein